ncbi:hypothetical protein BCR43DRAFT_481701 [Syncephalastrum racemosum]|uniref:Uncharacterized protein n=1 Tax=Syncephalastrum racemosum TaxID=13706 RepID=A0A1X2HSI8_SYNRA|nr:hypothetical protein BCR43DRAFT_481701 [Syncephalastrum racemosum]
MDLLLLKILLPCVFFSLAAVLLILWCVVMAKTKKQIREELAQDDYPFQDLESQATTSPFAEGQHRTLNEAKRHPQQHEPQSSSRPLSGENFDPPPVYST